MFMLIAVFLHSCRIAANKLVQVAVWDQAPDSATAVRYQYTNVLYTSGYYNCYTLAVTLGSVCNADQGATFSASPNDPGRVNCTCPAGTSCNPYIDLTQVIVVQCAGIGGGQLCTQCNLIHHPPASPSMQASTLFITATVSLGEFQDLTGLPNAADTCGATSVQQYGLTQPGGAGNTVTFNSQICVPNPPPPPQSPPPPPPPPPRPRPPKPPSPTPPPFPPPTMTTFTFFSSGSTVVWAPNVCASLITTFQYLLYSSIPYFESPPTCTGPGDAILGPGQIVTVFINFYSRLVGLGSIMNKEPNASHALPPYTESKP